MQVVPWPGDALVDHTRARLALLKDLPNLTGAGVVLLKVPEPFYSALHCSFWFSPCSSWLCHPL